MKRIPALLLFLALLSVSSYGQQIENESPDSWHSDKYSMFIHFGLYSHLGGVWDGEPVRQGYSEQIQSFAGIFSDWYAETAYEFNPDRFNADEIAILAKNAGMRSIVFTSKHHDGFCMYETETTSYNSMDMLPVGRDFVRELSEACRVHGLKFGLYFSLIDWNYPHAYPISSHNADFVTPEHHEFSKRQIRELLTSYGRISELWFDMGSLEPWQSREMYELVKSLQPDCMVSGRLGNDVYDFAVMADNKLPQTALHAPWQSAASMFPETWSYRSWQERGKLEDKVAEKLRTLISVVSKGGNYLLNIGPSSDGSVVPFEKDVLLSIGKWLERNGDAIYGTSSSPFHEEMSWGNITVKDDRMYLLLTGQCPDDGLIILPAYGMKLVSSSDTEAYMKGSDCVIRVDAGMYEDPCDVHVIRLDFDKPFSTMSSVRTVKQKDMLSWRNSLPEYSYSCFDYYSNYKSTVSYGWNVEVSRSIPSVEILFTQEERWKNILLQVDDVVLPVILSPSSVLEGGTGISLEGYSFGQVRGGTFDGPASLNTYLEATLPASDACVESDVLPFSNHIMKVTAKVDRTGLYVFDMTAGNGVEVIVDGETMMKHLNRYRTVERTEKVMIYLEKGLHQIALRTYNRFESKTTCGIQADAAQEVYVMNVVLPSVMTKGVHQIRVSSSDNASEHTDCGLHNIIIRL